MHHKAIWPIAKFRNRGFRGYPVVTVAFYGPDDRRASKVAVGILPNDRTDPDILQRWNVDEGDARDPACPFWAGRDRWSGEKPSSAE